MGTEAVALDSHSCGLGPVVPDSLLLTESFLREQALSEHVWRDS